MFTFYQVLRDYLCVIVICWQVTFWDVKWLSTLSVITVSKLEENQHHFIRLDTQYWPKLNIKVQESPPAWMQEAYCLPCSKYSLSYPNWVPPGQGTPWQGTPQQGTTPSRVPPHQGTPQQCTPLAGYPPRVPPPPGRVPPGYPHQGTPPPGYHPWLDLAGYPPWAAPWHSGKCCKALWDMGTPPVDRQMEGQTRVKTLPSRRTTYVGGKNVYPPGSPTMVPHGPWATMLHCGLPGTTMVQSQYHKLGLLIIKVPKAPSTMSPNNMDPQINH